MVNSSFEISVAPEVSGTFCSARFPPEPVLLVAMIFGYEETKIVPAAINGVDIDHESRAAKEDSKDPELARTKTPTEVSANLTVASIDPTIPRKTYKQRLALTTASPGSLGSFFRHCYQPFQTLFSVPGVFYMSLIYGGMMVASNVLSTSVPNMEDLAQIADVGMPDAFGSLLSGLIGDSNLEG